MASESYTSPTVLSRDYQVTDHPPSSKARAPYRLKHRAEREAATRQAIVQAAVALHQEVGPLATTVSALAQRAGVSRPTVYAHFADDIVLLAACTAHYRASHLPPDPATWLEIADPWRRLPTALSTIFAFWEDTAPMAASILRDARTAPERFGRVGFAMFMEACRDVLLAGWSWRGPNHRRRVTAVVAHAVAFDTWASVIRDGQMAQDDAIAVLIAAIRAAYARPSSGPS